jgi:hypothetical protein
VTDLDRLLDSVDDLEAATNGWTDSEINQLLEWFEREESDR